MLNAIKNYNENGLLAGWGFPNRRGLFVKNYYGIDGGCVEEKVGESSISILDINAKNIPLNSMVRDCYYLHYPHLSFLYIYFLNKIGLIEEFNNANLVASYLPWQIVFFTLLFMLIYEVTGLRWIALFIPLSYLLSQIYLSFQLSVGTPLFEMCFILATILFILKKKYHWCFSLGFLALFSGFDFLIPNIFLQAYALKKVKLKLNRVSLLGVIANAAFVFYFIAARFFIYDKNQLNEDVFEQIPLRVLGDHGFFQSIPRGIVSFFREIGQNYFDLYILFTILVVIVGGAIFRRDLKRIYHILFCLLLGLSLFLIVPGTTVYHTFSKAQFLVFFYIAVLSYFILDLVKFLSQKLKLSVDTIQWLGTIPLFVLVLIDPLYLSRLSKNFDQWHVSKNNYFGNSHIVDFTISAEQTSGGSLVNYRTQYMRSRVRAPFNQSKINPGKFQVFMQVRDLKSAQKVSFLFKDVNKKPQCDLFEVVNMRDMSARLEPVNALLKVGTYENHIRLDYAIVDIESDFIKIDCEAIEQVALERIWIE